MGTGLPLDGLTVLEFCQVAAGPFCGMLLADLGAEVLKIEPPGGDSMRHWPPFVDGFSANFASLNRNKRSVTLDLKTHGGRKLARSLAARANVILENNRPGVMKRLGLSHGELSQKRPDLVYASISAFGQTGPRASAGGFDVTMQAMSGIMSVTGEPDGAPVKAGVPICDFATGLYTALAIVALCRRVASGGPGGWIDQSMLGASLAVSALQVSEYFGSGRDPQPLGSAHPRNAPYQLFQASDGYFALAAGNDMLWAATCSELGASDLLADPRFSTTSARATHQRELATHLSPIFARESVSAWCSRFAAAGVPCEPLNSFSAALADPQVAHMGWVQPLPLPSGGTVDMLGPVTAIDGINLGIRERPPALGEHNLAALSGGGT